MRSRRADCGEPPAPSCAARCARRRAHCRRAQRMACAFRAAAVRCCCFIVAWGVGPARVRGGCSEVGYREARPRGGKDRRKRASRSGGRSLSIGWARGGSLGRLRLRGDREGACCWCCAPCGGRAPRERSTDARRFRLFFAFSVHAGVDWRTLPCFPCDELSPILVHLAWRRNFKMAH